MTNKFDDQSFEDHLRSALRPRPPSDGFAGRVMSRLPAPPRRKRTRLPAWLALAAALLLGVFLANSWYETRRAAREKAREDTMLALRIVSNSLNEARARILTRSRPVGFESDSEPEVQNPEE